MSDYIPVKDKRLQYDERHDKVILQDDNTRPHIAKTVQETLQVLNWEILPHPPYSSSDCHLFRSIHSALLGDLFSSCNEVTKTNGLLLKNQIFYRNSIVTCIWKNVVLFNKKYFEWNIFYFTISIFALLFIKKRCTPNIYSGSPIYTIVHSFTMK